MKNRGILLEEIQIEGKVQVLEQIRETVEAKDIRYQPSLIQMVLGHIKYLSLPALGGRLPVCF